MDHGRRFPKVFPKILLVLPMLLTLVFLKPVNGSPAQNAGDFLFKEGAAAQPPLMLGAELGQFPDQPTGMVAEAYDSVYSNLFILILVLVIIVLLLLFITMNLVNLVRVREGKEAMTLQYTIKESMRLAMNPFINSAVGLVVTLVIVGMLIPVARGVGLHQYYQPDQPVKYSHKVHAGKLEIDCQYCHSGASKGKSAWIPSVNVCMNCHKAVESGTLTGTEEIKKVRDAYVNNKPIEWVRIHNLPDFVYFNHQQHVVAGGVDCTVCHGPVKEMDVMYQYSPLSMGWCINCHEETKVDKKLYEKIGRPDATTVESIGGKNCARCHY